MTCGKSHKKKEDLVKFDGTEAALQEISLGILDDIYKANRSLHKEAAAVQRTLLRKYAKSLKAPGFVPKSIDIKNISGALEKSEQSLARTLESARTLSAGRQSGEIVGDELDSTIAQIGDALKGIKEIIESGQNIPAQWKTVAFSPSDSVADSVPREQQLGENLRGGPGDVLVGSSDAPLPADGEESPAGDGDNSGPGDNAGQGGGASETQGDLCS